MSDAKEPEEQLDYVAQLRAERDREHTRRLELEGQVEELEAELSRAQSANTEPLDRLGRGPVTTLDKLPNGAIFETAELVHGHRVFAVKSEYHYPGVGGAPQCVLLASGEYAHFPEKGKAKVREVIVYRDEGATR